MTTNDLNAMEGFHIVVSPTQSRPVSGVFCCDMLSLAMSRGIEGAAWVTVMGNVNTLAVCKLTDMSCIVLAEGVQPDDRMQQKAAEEGIPVFTTDLPVFEAALRIHTALSAKAAS